MISMQSTRYMIASGALSSKLCGRIVTYQQRSTLRVLALRMRERVSGGAKMATGGACMKLRQIVQGDAGQRCFEGARRV
jgi:hypothetical protein